LKRLSSSPNPGITSISMKHAGRTMVAVIGSVRIFASMRALVSKCPIPVGLSLKDANEV
jgi:hypothetical protein